MTVLRYASPREIILAAIVQRETLLYKLKNYSDSFF
jgi:hypothetical protein